jgi:hypothetical protein
MRTRQFDVYWQATGSAYKSLLEHLGAFFSSPTDHSKYLAFLTAHQTALLFASDEVAERLTGRTGASVNAQRLRVADTEETRSVINSTKWYDAVEAVTAAMRNDLKRLDKK